MKSGYEGFSTVYDTLMADYNYAAVTAFIAKEVAVCGKKGLDLCCGTGTVAIALAKEGATLTGFDLDKNMLSHAAEKAKAEAQAIRFLQGDINNIPQMQPFHFIISTCDGLNYVKNLAQFAQSLYSLLRPQGKVILEFSSLYKAQHTLCDNLFYEDGQEVTWFFQNNFNPNKNIVTQNLTIFQSDNSGKYTRSDDEAVQYFYTTEQILTAFQTAGFADVRLLNSQNFALAEDSAERLALVCEKK